MSLVTRISNELSILPIDFSDSDIESSITNFSEKKDEQLTEKLSESPYNTVFKVPEIYLIPNKLFVFKQSSLNNIKVLDNLLTSETYNYLDNSFTQTKDVAIDYNNSKLKFLVPIDFTKDFVIVSFFFVSFNDLFNDFMIKAGLVDRKKLERRGSVTEEFTNLLELAKKKIDLEKNSGISRIKNIEMTRQSHGKIYGNYT